MRWTDADYNPKAKSDISSVLGDFSAKMKCAVWDWGDRFRQDKMVEHLSEIHVRANVSLHNCKSGMQEYYSKLNPPDWLREGIELRLKAQTAEVAKDEGTTESPTKKSKTSSET